MLQRLAREFRSAEFFLEQALADRSDRIILHRSITLGTLKYPLPETGAFASASAFDKHGFSRSSRRVAVSSALNRTCAIGSIPLVSSSFSLSMWLRMLSRSFAIFSTSSSRNASAANSATRSTSSLVIFILFYATAGTTYRALDPPPSPVQWHAP